MVRRFLMCGGIAFAAGIVGCANDAATPSPLAPQAPKFARHSGPTDPTSTLYFPLDDASLGVKSDHLFVSGTSSAYAQGVCGVDSKIFATTEASNSGDLVMQTDNPTYRDHKCSAYPRKLVIDYGDGTAPRASTVFVNLRDLERENDPADQISIGGSRIRGLHVNESRCGGLVYQAQLGDGTSTNGADSVIVTRTAADTWVVTTQPAPNDKAYCKGDGLLYHIPVNFTIVSSRPLAAP